MKKYIKIACSVLALIPLVSSAYFIIPAYHPPQRQINTSANVSGISNAHQNAASVISVGGYKANAIGSAAKAELLIPVTLSNSSMGAMNSSSVSVRSGGSDVSHITMTENNNNSGNSTSFEALPATLLIAQ